LLSQHQDVIIAQLTEENKLRLKILISFLCVCFLAITFSSAGEDPHGDFIYTSGTNLMLHGKPFRYVGANTYYLMVYSATPDLKRYVNEIFDDAEKIGIKVIRTWAFNDGQRQWNALQKSPGVYSEVTFTGLDYVVAKAKEKNIYLIFTLVNNFSDYGGARQYVDWSPTAKLKDHREFFTDPTAREYYKNHVKAVLTRKNTLTGTVYSDEPAIMAWQLINEPTIANDPSGDILHGWIKDMSEYIKSIDKRHLVMVGEEGFYAGANRYDWKLNGSKGQDFVRDHSLPAVDVASFHLWPNSSKYNLGPEQTADWIKRHVEDAKKIGKPLVCDEFGEYRGYNGDTIERDRLYTLIFERMEEFNISGVNFWQLLHNEYISCDDGYGVYYPDDKSTIEIIKSANEKTRLK